MRALVLRGFCISVGVDAQVDEVVDLPPALYREMLISEAIAPAPEEAQNESTSQEAKPSSAPKSTKERR